MALNDAAFLQLLQQTFGHRLGRFGRLGTRHAYPLHLVTAERITAERSVIVGNAAHGLHPVAGQGFNLGLRDVATLAEILADRAQNSEISKDVGAPELLERYREWRYRDQRNVVAFTDGLIHLFDIPSNAAAVARGFGLLAFDMLPRVKRALAHHTMGLSGTLTRLARGLPL
jgi:2-octaprenyl-6-methoxyphenol hydroxylase